MNFSLKKSLASILRLFLVAGFIISMFLPSTSIAQSGAALSFDGSNDYVETPASINALGLSTTATWECWAKFNNLNSSQTLFDMNTGFNIDGMYINLFQGSFYYTQKTPSGLS